MQTRSGRQYSFAVPMYPERPYPARRSFGAQADFFPQALQNYRPAEEAFLIDLGQGKTLITPFDGTGSVIDFLDRFTIVSQAKEWDPGHKSAWFPVYLKGAAALYYKGLLDATKQDWDLLNQAFLDQYNDADARNLQITKLSKIRQTPNESVMQFGARLKQMALTAYEGMNANQVEPLLRV